MTVIEVVPVCFNKASHLSDPAIAMKPPMRHILTFFGIIYKKNLKKYGFIFLLLNVAQLSIVVLMSCQTQLCFRLFLDSFCFCICFVLVSFFCFFQFPVWSSSALKKWLRKTSRNYKYLPVTIIIRFLDLCLKKRKNCCQLILHPLYKADLLVEVRHCPLYRYSIMKLLLLL